MANSDLFRDLVCPPDVLAAVNEGLYRGYNGLVLLLALLLLGLQCLAVAMLGAEVLQDAINKQSPNGELCSDLLGCGFVNDESFVDCE